MQLGDDPPVTTDLCGVRLSLPFSHALPQWRRQDPHYAENLGEVARLVAEQGGRTMIDVGANVGDSAAIVKAYAPELEILCIDADPTYVPYLIANTARWPDVEVAAPILLAERRASIKGRLEADRGTSRFVVVEEQSEAVTLDDIVEGRPRFHMPALLKSDTDGFEARVLQGAATLLAEARPVLFLEFNPGLLHAAGSDGLEMLRNLNALGYERIAFYDKFGMLMLKCSLNDKWILSDLYAYAERNSSRGVDHYDIVVASAERAPVIDRLTGRAEPGSAASLP